MDDELAFLRARLDEDETMAVATSPSETRLTWEVDAGDAPARYCVISAGNVAGVAEALALERATGAAVARHIARHDPARVLREVAAKRAILRRYVDGDDALYVAVLELISAYSDHADYSAVRRTRS